MPISLSQLDLFFTQLRTKALGSRPIPNARNFLRCDVLGTKKHTRDNCLSFGALPEGGVYRVTERHQC